MFSYVLSLGFGLIDLGCLFRPYFVLFPDEVAEPPRLDNRGSCRIKPLDLRKPYSEVEIFSEPSGGPSYTRPCLCWEMGVENGTRVTRLSDIWSGSVSPR
jgi:hypothetical protein